MQIVDKMRILGETPAEILENIPEYYSPDPFNLRPMKLLYNIVYSSGNKDKWSIEIDKEKCHVLKGQSFSVYDAEIIVSGNDYIRLVYGLLNYGNAIWIGRIRFVGSTLIHREFNTHFKFEEKLGIQCI